MTAAFKTRARRWLVRTAVGSLCCVGVLVLVQRGAQARAKARLMEVGVQLLDFAGAEHLDSRRSFVVNGLELAVTSGVSSAPVSSVVAVTADRCRSNGSGPAIALQELDAEAGFAACGLGGFDLSSPGALAASAQELLADGTLILGPIEYVYAERAGGKTHFVSFSAPSLDVLGVFPRGGDAPVDRPPAARPPDGRLLLSAYEVGHDYRVEIHGDGASSPDDSVAAVARQTESLGFQLLSRHTSDERASALAVRGDDMLLVVSESRRGATSTVLLWAGRGTMQRLGEAGLPTRRDP